MTADETHAVVVTAAAIPETQWPAEATHTLVDVDGCTDARAVIARISAAMAFPEWAGRNWDALEELLCDPASRNGAPHVLTITGLRALREHDQPGWTTLLDIAVNAAESGALSTNLAERA